MIIEPRQAGPGALRRWTRLAFRLIARGFGYWLGLVLLVCLWMFAGQRLPLVDGMLALTAFFASILIAAKLDRPERTSLTEVLRMLREHAIEILLFAAVISIAGAIIWALLLARPEVPWWTVLYSDRNLVTEPSDNWFLALRQIFVYSAVALGLLFFGLNIPGLTSFFQFPCTTLLGLPFRDAYRIGAIGQILNLPAILAIGLMFIMLPVLSLLLLPLLVPVLYCFLGALTYVGFREIFLGIPDNRLADRAGAAVPAPST
ncbi:MAG: hypothetical protein U1F18_00940 [Steroidobacteraceae bacterium]|jgi:hypothetical protein